MKLDDPRWADLKGGYRLPYDPRAALTAISMPFTAAAGWAELWQNLHHQGDVGEASYAAVISIADVAARQENPDWNAYAIAAVIERCRPDQRNPALPAWLIDDYADALSRLLKSAVLHLQNAEEETLVSSLIAFIAEHKGHLTLSDLALLCEDERRELLEDRDG